MIIDSHCHLDYPDLYDQLDKVLERAKNNKVKYFLTISTTLASFEKIKLIIKKYDNVYGTLGIHPHETKNFNTINSTILINLQKNNKKIVGIGETGLDYYYNHMFLQEMMINFHLRGNRHNHQVFHLNQYL